MRYGILFSLGMAVFALEVAAQSAVDVVRPEEQQKARRAVVKQQEKRAKRASIIEFRGEQAFSDKDLRLGLKEEITTIEDFGLSPARARLTGAGFGGCVVALAPVDGVNRVASDAARAYAARTGRSPTAWTMAAAPGAGPLGADA